MIVIPSLSVLATIAAVAARVPRKLIGITILVAALIPVQILINTIGGRDNARSTTGGVAVMGLHVINGLAIMLIARAALRGARTLMKGGSPDAVASAEPGGGVASVTADSPTASAT